MASGTNQPNSGDPEPRDFLARVETIRRTVLIEYPTARLYYVKATTTQSADGGVTSPSALTEMEVMFRLDDAVATVTSTGPDDVGPIELRPGPILGNANLDWPIKMDLTEADALLKQNGHTDSYDSVTLRKPLYPGMNENYYFFSMVEGSDVSVGTENHNVS